MLLSMSTVLPQVSWSQRALLRTLFKATPTLKLRLIKNTAAKKNLKLSKKGGDAPAAVKGLNRKDEEGKKAMIDNLDHSMLIVLLLASLSPKDLSRTRLKDIHPVAQKRSNREDNKRAREKLEEENFHSRSKKRNREKVNQSQRKQENKRKASLPQKQEKRIRGNMVHLMLTGLQQVNLFRKALSKTQFKNSQMSKLR